MKKHITTALTATILSAALTVPATAAEIPVIRMSSYKGNSLEAGERSFLTIGPARAGGHGKLRQAGDRRCRAVLTYWVAVTKTEGTAEITITGRAGDTRSLTLTVGTPKADSVFVLSEGTDLTANMELRQEMIHLINEVRRENGAAKLEVNESLMNAAQDCFAQMFTGHNRSMGVKRPSGTDTPMASAIS